MNPETKPASDGETTFKPAFEIPTKLTDYRGGAEVSNYPEGVRDAQDYKDYLEEQAARTKEATSEIPLSRQDLIQANKDIITVHDGKDGKLYANRTEGFAPAISNSELAQIDANAELIRDSQEEREKDYATYKAEQAKQTIETIAPETNEEITPSLSNEKNFSTVVEFKEITGEDETKEAFSCQAYYKSASELSRETGTDVSGGEIAEIIAGRQRFRLLDLCNRDENDPYADAYNGVVRFIEVNPDYHKFDGKLRSMYKYKTQRYNADYLLVTDDFFDSNGYTGYIEITQDSQPVEIGRNHERPNMKIDKTVSGSHFTLEPFLTKKPGHETDRFFTFTKRKTTNPTKISYVEQKDN